MNRLCIIASLVVMAVVGFGQENTQPVDPFNMSKLQEQIDEIGVPTVTAVTALHTQALALYQGGNWEEAAEALQLYAKNANWLANLISDGLEPYYGASYDVRKAYPYKKIKPLIKYENLANDYRKLRNEARVMEAECYAKLGEKSKAVALFSKSLDLIDIKNEVYWRRAQKGLYLIIGVE
ncbi:MAG: hypothetical protein HOG49_35240 [Candidatus Scalindua sp.]|jgi:tetratricopeptide (TPR) repeat protein|nr:hypothetical protein [Candidatus Scalindua sp.]